MPWTATILSHDPLAARATVKFTNGTLEVEKTLVAEDLTQFKADCRAEVARLSNRPTFTPGQVVDLTPPPADSTHTARQAYQAAVDKLKRAKEVIALAGDAATKIDLAALEADVVTALDPTVIALDAKR